MKNEVKTKKITIEKLAIMMNNSFESLKKEVVGIVHGELIGIKKDISDINIRITGIDNKLEGTNKRIDDLAENRVKVAEHNKLKARVSLIEEKI